MTAGQQYGWKWVNFIQEELHSYWIWTQWWCGWLVIISPTAGAGVPLQTNTCAAAISYLTAISGNRLWFVSFHLKVGSTKTNGRGRCGGESNSCEAEWCIESGVSAAQYGGVHQVTQLSLDASSFESKWLDLLFECFSSFSFFFFYTNSCIKWIRHRTVRESRAAAIATNRAMERQTLCTKSTHRSLIISHM